MKRFVLPILTFITLTQCVPVSPTSSSPGMELLYEDINYVPEVQTVQLYPFQGKDSDILQSPIVTLAQSGSLILRFDLLQENTEVLHAKIVHCNFDWTKSWLGDVEYLSAYNEFPINQFTYSVSTKVPYIHYELRVPKVKVTGNYLIYVYRNNDEGDLLLSRRFVVYKNDVGIEEEIGLSTNVHLRGSHQQIQFKISHPKTLVMNPTEDIRVVLRQNQRWDNAITKLKPNFFKEDMRVLEYNHFDGSNNFPGNNEFRFFDLRMLLSRGQRIDKVIPGSIPTVNIDADMPRGSRPYAQNLDINGNYFIQNLDRGGGNIESEYIKTNFTLKADQAYQGDIYLMGQLTQWRKEAYNKMQYNAERKQYELQLLLKQGWYNYQYESTLKEESQLLEGYYFPAENNYEILVYYRLQGARYDQVIGYKSINYNRPN
ncbi:type IX secretion system plug protein [Shiella aurantiaca]|uniref:type IX secretion system plug protein n=1 Tax=Shiella aurantiaca TaxID=3058365 RepID=UPI0029F590F7|nr:DUF5103 domain-containing protein [Shiella aurantiaca]